MQEDRRRERRGEWPPYSCVCVCALTETLGCFFLRKLCLCVCVLNLGGSALLLPANQMLPPRLYHRFGSQLAGQLRAPTIRPLRRASSSTPEITFFTRKNCGLCQEAAEVLKSLNLSYHTVDIDSDSKWEKYTFDVPVLHIGNELAMMHRFDREEILRLLRTRQTSTSAESESAPKSD